MRLFIAAVLPSEIERALAHNIAMLRESVRGRFVSPDSLHVTLAFLGNVDGSRVPDVCGAMDDALAGMHAFDVALGEYGCFGKRSSATLWQGFSDNNRFRRLAEPLRSELGLRGFSFDAKRFTAHVTLMRKADLSAGVLPAPLLKQGTVSSVCLFESDLSGALPKYECLYSIELL